MLAPNAVQLPIAHVQAFEHVFVPLLADCQITTSKLTLPQNVSKEVDLLEVGMEAIIDKKKAATGSPYIRLSFQVNANGTFRQQEPREILPLFVGNFSNFDNLQNEIIHCAGASRQAIENNSRYSCKHLVSIVDLVTTRYDEGRGPLHVDFPDEFLISSPNSSASDYAFTRSLTKAGTEIWLHNKQLIGENNLPELCREAIDQDPVCKRLLMKAGCQESVVLPPESVASFRTGITIHNSPESQMARSALVIALVSEDVAKIYSDTQQQIANYRSYLN